ncbi:hypothetical protein IW262DRAFT_340152 [Armillaria fumosa]|nr:hypothetical protein IW262DRAFT_340152 [Armillaria fumosa]
MSLEDTCTSCDSALKLTPLMPCIPPEIIDEIIDYLSDDRRALVACSTVCRLFYHRTRQHIFRTICFTGYHRHPVARFVNIVNASPHLLSCVIDMKIHGNTAFLSLHLLLPSMVNLTSLRMAFVSFSSGDDFHACIFKLLRLKELSLFCISSDKPDFSIETLSPCSGPALESIKIEGGDKNIGLLPSFLLTGLRAVYMDALKYLELRSPAEEDLQVLCEIYQVARSLRLLSLVAVQSTLHQWPGLATLPLTGLESLIVELCYQIDDERSDIHVMRWLAASFDAISKPTSLRSFELKVVLSGKNKLREDDAEIWLSCTRLDGALHQPELAQFR